VEDLEDVDRRPSEVVSRIPSGDRAYLLETLTSEEAGRAEAIGNLHASGLVPEAVELLIDAEEDRTLRAVLVGMLRETGR
jgi:hypothetical protein